MRHGTRRFTTDQSTDRLIEEMRVKIADNLQIPVERVRYVRSDRPGQFGETGLRWEILYHEIWRELPWHFDGPLCVDRAIVRRWYGT